MLYNLEVEIKRKLNADIYHEKINEVDFTLKDMHQKTEKTNEAQKEVNANYKKRLDEQQEKD